MSLRDEIKRELSKSHSISDIKGNLLKRGYLEEDIDNVLSEFIESKSAEHSKNNLILSLKELSDRIGYGFSSQQFINILFMFSGASLFLIGLINSFKTAFISLLSGVLSELKKVKNISKNIISTSGITYGFSFLGMTFAVIIKSPILFAISLLIGSLGIIAHGDLFVEYSKSLLKQEKRSGFLKLISYFGIIITSISLIIAGFIMEFFPINGMLINLGFLGFPNLQFKIFGYLLIFEMTAIIFIISGYFLSLLKDTEEVFTHDMHFLHFLKHYFSESVSSYKVFSKNKKVYLLMIASVSTIVLQVIGNSYYGIFIYERFKNQFLGGFLNVAIVFVVALLASLVGGIFTKSFSKSLGEAPMLVFGTLLIALMPFTLFYNPKIYAIIIAAALSIVGATIVGIAQGLLAERLLLESEMRTFFSSLGFVSIIPVIAIGTLGAVIAQSLGLQQLFLYIGIALSCIVMPIYFIIVLILELEYRHEKSKKTNSYNNIKEALLKQN
ncbi:MAG: hypothetical protein KatS3mg002_0026 [Candidatus Woesearchaeota archaeon]|nr:MAG: hypothetical protein KatS3mg002_0026 [Candidatus Woesearchaeota archaeon]